MSGSLNKVILIGNLGRDPEVRTFTSGGKVCSLRIATSENWKDRDTGERRERTEWHSVEIYSEGLVKVAEQYLRKGSKVYLEGQLQTRKWADRDGNDRYSTEVVLQGYGATLTMLDGASGDGTGANRSGGSNGYGQSSGGYGNSSDGYGGDASGSYGYGGTNHGPNGNQAPDHDTRHRDLDDEIPF